MVTSKKSSSSVVDIINRWADRNFRNSANKSASNLNKKIQKKVEPIRKEAQKANTNIQKKYGDPARKKAAEVNKKLQSKIGDPIREATYGKNINLNNKKSETKKVEPKKADSKKQTTPSKPKSNSSSIKKPETKKPETKPEVVNNNLTTGPTVSQLWKEKTGTSWSEAKKQGLTDGSATSNIALMKKLQSGQITKPSSYEDTFKKNMERDVEDELSGKIKFDEPTKTARYGGSMKKMQAGGMTNNISTAKGARLNPTGRKTAMTALGIKGRMGKMKTGGMVNSNSKVSAIKSAGSKGVKTGANTRISASKIARGRVGGTSTAPRTAAPKAMYGMSMKPGMMRKGGTKKK